MGLSQVRFLLTIYIGKLVGLATRLFKQGAGTAAPGLAATFLYPSILSEFTKQLPHGSILVSGTNGKTTTSRMISSVLSQNGEKVIHNRTGSNLIRGLVSTCIKHSSMTGKLSEELGLWEVDEATLPLAVKAVKPKIVLITNLFRDQLDRYGEVNTVARKWKEGLANLPKDSTLILNADDPSVAHLGHNFPGRVIYFGLSDTRHSLEKTPDAADNIFCLRCATPLLYDAIFVSHMGHFKCPKCGHIRPDPNWEAENININATTDISFTVNSREEKFDLILPIAGLFNVYNALAAVTVLFALGIEKQIIVNALLKFKAAFGRLERLTIGNQKEAVLFLAKNPTGFNEVIRTILYDEKWKNVVIAINDLIADGTDVSWLWDVDFEKFAGRVRFVNVTGIRAYDMALRLKYAGVEKSKICLHFADAKSKIFVHTNLKDAIADGIAKTEERETLFIIPTYTAMLTVKKIFSDMNLSTKWHED